MHDGTRTGPPPGTAGYGETAEALAEQYESVDFAEVHREVLHLFPERPGTVLDIGAGTGRDAAALAGRGHRVVAVEPTAALRAVGRRLHADRDIEWIDDALPGLRTLLGRRFGLVLLTAVWMHLDEDERPAAMETVSGLVGSGGRVVLSLRHGPVPPGRRMFPVTADETAALARRYGLAALHLAHGGDPLGRADVTWSHLVLERP
ncbi:class I SAM-dependent methyltransferase [Streptomyces mobaraensis NBRC 13819 = DSM 40847]|uniref:Putative methyltransferase n=1 Tax=Streptomyces mobaraensis (strain ATCC 29032 / DSM 40847 / JCM 4168 / NBRC 13819 / NCIMB 11159 / IPCR 16-22) TaxID=1223523 RepID=M3C7R4_STRM1|nr:class I SAM-dependent methyltransferase [Streptomyces mobaraensis]EME99966.1 putative methyltransferase [Streptomyces mobaraensis NBRC 13819 = DSM 40847]QTT72195.1 class I SAM-dependent methyltransferase [Streptomyces mobaraensis NBRC 13819 = DSM 40847]